MITLPPSPFPDINRTTLPAGTELHRVHASDFAGNSFNPCRGRLSRFAPLRRPDGTCVATAYAASTLECAVHETVFHEIQHDAPKKSIGFHVVENLTHAMLRLRRPLVLACLFEPDLNKWGLTRLSLIDTFAADYPDTAKWALAIRDQHRDADGLVWTSRRCDPERAYVLFGDSVGSDDLEIVSTERIAESNALLRQIRDFAQRAGILIAF
jgi:hypothetical protein